MLFNPYTLSFLGTWRHGDSTYGYTYGDRDTIYHHYTLSFFGDVGTVPTDKHTEIETQYTTPIHSHFWGRGDSSYGYTYGDRDTIYHHPYTLIFGDLGTWGQYPRIYIRRQGHNIPPLYTLIFGDLGTWGQYPRIYIRR